MQEGKTVVAFSASAEHRPARLRRQLQPLAARRQRRGGQQGRDRDRDRGRPGRLTDRWPARIGPGRLRVRFPAMPTPRTACAPGRPPSSALDRSPTTPYVLAVDLGTGGPKVAVLSATGRIVAHAFQAVGIDLTDDGGAEQSPAGLVGRHRGVGPARRWPTAAWRPSDVVGIGCTSQWSGTVPVDDDGRRHRSRHHLDGLPGRPGRPRDRARRAQRPGLLGLQAGPLGAAHRRHPEPVGQGPGGPHPLPAPAAPRRLRAPTAVFLEPVDYLNLRLTGLARASHDSITLHWVTDNRDINADRLRRRADRAGRPRARQAARPGADGQRARRAGARPPPPSSACSPGTPVVAGTGRPALGRRRLGRGGRLRRPPLHRHLELDQLPRPLQEDRRADQHRLHPLGHPGPLPGRRRARDRGCLPDLAARQPALPRRRPAPRRAAAGPPDDVLRHAQRRRGIGPGRLPRRPVHAVAQRRALARSTTTPSAAASTTSRCRRPGPTWCGPCSRASRSTRPGCSGAVEKFCKRPFDSLAFVGGGANSDLWSQIHADATGRTIRQIADPVLANVRGAGLLTLLALGHLARRRHPGHRRPSRPPTSPIRPPARSTPRCSRSSSTSTRRRRPSTSG